MHHFIGCKAIQAEPAMRITHHDGSVEIVSLGEPTHFDCVKMEPGYKVLYPDGYVSWSPAKQFEDAYLPVIVNPDLKTDKPSISQAMVDEFIDEVYINTIGEKTTLVRVVLRNGFELVESSSCVSAENYDENLGAEICMKKIKDKVWFLLGFLLQTAVNGLNSTRDIGGQCDGAGQCPNCCAEEG